jgi:hypothetical protein
VKAWWETFREPVEGNWRIEGGAAPGLRAAEIGSGHYDVEVKDFRK